MNQHDATLAAEALAAECLALRSEVARLRGVIEDCLPMIGGCYESPVGYCDNHNCGMPCYAGLLRAALSQPVQGGGE